MTTHRTGSATLVALCAGLDPGGQAGLAADLHACFLAGADGRPVLTARTAQGDGRFSGAWPVPAAEFAQVLASLDLPAGRSAVKTGMLGSVALGRTLLGWLLARPDLPLVVDPLPRTSSGGWLWPDDSEAEVLAFLRHELLPKATVVTPNWNELAWLAGTPPLADREAARAALARLPCAAVVKGGHAPAPWLGTDWLWDGRTLEPLPATAIWTGEVRGTGCRFATALAVGLARGETLAAAAGQAKALVAGHAIARLAAR